MIVPILVTASILGGIYYFAPRAAEMLPVQPGPQPTPIPSAQIPTELQRRMQDTLAALPPQYQALIPPEQFGNPAAWTALAQSFGAAFPMSPQSPELLAIANTLSALSGQPPQPIPVPPAPIPLPPQLQARLQQVLAGLPPPFNSPTVLIPAPLGMPGQPPFAVDPAQLVLLATQIEMALGAARPEPALLRSLAAQLRSPNSNVMAPIGRYPRGWP